VVVVGLLVAPTSLTKFITTLDFCITQSEERIWKKESEKRAFENHFDNHVLS